MWQTDEPWALIAQLATQACCCSKGRSAWLSISEWRQLLASHPALSPSSQHLLSFQSFPQRTYHEHLTVIIHLHEVTVTTGAPGAKAAGRSAERRAAGEEGDGLRYVLGSQAWAALHVFSRGYCNTGVYQLPLYQGAPSQSLLVALSQGECRSTLEHLAAENKVQLLEGASLVARIADGRREEELRTYRAEDIDQSYLPKENVESYAKEPHGSKVAELMTWDKAETQRQERRARLLILDQI
ncbi:uncharacterized protein LOC132250708 isoform X1 [Alligator mississippiensis]|uniref:uncharacterized protein LOC132250708 isoform X1 n=1 Tax=Alligator mississippiensis TaxID=8496 RepID=UPI0028776FCA|nr:uncharacterized protein LOC132250708 isoform X1 [Alligator mississippiensis]